MADDAVMMLRQGGEQVEAYLRAALRRSTTAPRRLMEAMEYSLWAGGKRLRPTLALETARACGQATASTLAAAGAIELIHTFSLIHDDLPAMDNDDLRRGRPTNHKVFGEAMAILAGDAMVAAAFELLARDAEPALAGRLIAELAGATGPGGMIGGQVLDMEGESKRLSVQELQQLHRMKTGALLVAACRLGALSAAATEAQVQQLTGFSQHLGLAFQIVDDVLDETATPEQLGKATGKDAGKGKNTYPALLGVEESKRRAMDELGMALKALDGFGPQAERLRVLARFVVERDR